MRYTQGEQARAGDGLLFDSALTLVRRRTGVDLAFGGQVSAGELCLSEFRGALTRGLVGLRVGPGLGLGGHVLTAGQPARVSDYENATSITHDYDDPVLGEGIRGVLASPVLVRGSVRGVLYAGVRTDSVLANKATDALTQVSRQLAGELRIRDEVDRRVRALTTTNEQRVHNGQATATHDNAQELHAQVRRIARDVDDPELRSKLLNACVRFEGGDGDTAAHTPCTLSPRERDVLAEVALELTNTEIAQRLVLRPETVKAYLRSLMRKLDVHSRHQAVAVARRSGLLD